MWVSENVNMPIGIIEALENGELVVFAGAGVSMGSPSDHPNFVGLAQQIADRQLTEPEKNHVDEFLGSLVEGGREVHDLAHEILSKPDSKPTSLHRSLLSLFRPTGILRIVTTNFDTHFTKASHELFPEIETYYAPALPLGSYFDGLVYLHGSVEKTSSRLILTDRDFGRAYLTDGWATRFLRELFSYYTVLFVGYSHNDPVMKYLARGLPLNNNKRYAFSEPNKEGEWRYLGIEPIVYPLQNGQDDEHSSLNDAIEKWSILSNMGALDHEVLIKQIVDSTPPFDKESADYIISALNKPVTTKFFTRYARSQEWFIWAEQQEVFQQLFRRDGAQNEVSQLLASWFAEYYAFCLPGEALGLVQRLGQHFSRVLWGNIAWKLAHITPVPDAQWLAKWVVVLLEAALPDSRIDYFEYILGNCRHPEDSHAAILLFEYLIRPKLKLESHVSFFNKDKTDVDAEIEVKGNYYWLNKAWEDLFRPNLADYLFPVETIVTGQLTRAHLMLRAMGQADERYDRISIGRSAIEPHEQDRHPDQFDVIIDAARDIIEYLLKYNVSQADRSINAWVNCEVPVLKRLALHGIIENTTVKPDEKIQLVLEKNWLFNSGMKHEIFRLLARAYPEGSLTLREQLLDRIMEYYRGASDQDELEVRTYEAYNILVWLETIAPECPLIGKCLNKIRAAHPDFRPREHPDFDSWSSEGVWGSESPFTVEELLQKDPREDIDWLLDYKEKDWAGPSRGGLLDIISQSVSRDFEWSWKLVEVLALRSKWTSDLWERIVYGWQKGMLEPRNWERVFSFLCAAPQLYELEKPIADLLEGSVDGREQPRLSLEVLPIAEQLASKIYEYTVARNEEIPIESDDWLMNAINHAGGKLALFWLHALSIKRQEKEDGQADTLSENRIIFERILNANNNTSEMARVILASQLHFLFAADSDWTKQYILPLFDPINDEKQAEQAWHGFAGWGRLNEAFVPALLINAVKYSQRLDGQSKEIRRRICGLLASITLYSSENPMDPGWLMELIKQAGPLARKEWASMLGIQLASADQHAVIEAWNSWVKKYWLRRNSGFPHPLNDEEKEEMVRWLIHLEPVFPEAVELICAKPAPHQMDLYWLLHKMIEKNIVNKYPCEFSRLLEHLLAGRTEGFRGDINKILESLIQHPDCQPCLIRICDRLTELGFENMITWREKIDKMPFADQK